MEHEEDIKQILLNILQIGILNARAAAWGSHSELCASETDHIHNLPSLIRSPNIKELSYYYDISRIDFKRHTTDTKAFDQEWALLGEILNELLGKDPNQQN